MASPASLTSALFIYVFIKVCAEMRRREPSFSFSFSTPTPPHPQIKSTLPTESLLHHYRRSLSCRLQFGLARGMLRSQMHHHSALFSGMNSDPPPWFPFTVSALPLLLLCRFFFFSTALCHAHTPQTPVMQYDLFSYQLLTLSTISDSCWHQHTQAKVFRCAPAVSR